MIFLQKINLFTGDYKNEDGTHSTEAVIGHPDRMKKGKQQYGGQYTSGTANKYRLGALYVGYRGIRYGINSDRYVRHPIQNHFAHNFAKPQSGFRSYSNSISPYSQFRSFNPFTLW